MTCSDNIFEKYESITLLFIDLGSLPWCPWFTIARPKQLNKSHVVRTARVQKASEHKAQMGRSDWVSVDDNTVIVRLAME